jgi:DNA-binding MarR family transcriptional regulator
MSDVKRPAVRFRPGPGGGGPLDNLGFLLSQLGFIASRRFHTVMAAMDLEPRQFLLLRFLAGDEGRSQQALGERLRIPASRMVAIVDSLEERGLVERRLNPSDRRTRALYLTAAGRRMLTRAMRLATEYEGTLGTSLKADERRQLVRLLQRLAAEMDLLSGVHPGLSDEHGEDWKPPRRS